MDNHMQSATGGTGHRLALVGLAVTIGAALGLAMDVREPGEPAIVALETAPLAGAIAPAAPAAPAATSGAASGAASPEGVGPSDGVVEREILRLTNELRADPAGPLARRSPMPPCVNEDFYRIEMDAASGHPAPVPALAADDRVATRMADEWARTMEAEDRFEHRPAPSQEAIYAELALTVAAWGENIAWFAGYPAEDTARVHFEGWRESDTGHYCSLITGRFTHVGIAEHRLGDESWAVQNFYALDP